MIFLLLGLAEEPASLDNSTPAPCKLSLVLGLGIYKIVLRSNCHLNALACTCGAALVGLQGSHASGVDTSCWVGKQVPNCLTC